MCKTTPALRPAWIEGVPGSSRTGLTAWCSSQKCELNRKMPNTANRDSWVVACPCEVLPSLVVRQTPPDPTRGRGLNQIRETPPRRTHYGPSDVQQSQRLLGYAPINGNASAHKAQMQHVNIDLWTSTRTSHPQEVCQLSNMLPSSFTSWDVSKDRVAVFQIPSS